MCLHIWGLAYLGKFQLKLKFYAFCSSSIFIVLEFKMRAKLTMNNYFYSFPHRVEAALIIWSIIFILLGRALNIFPLAELCNRFRTHKITKKMMVIMWFSGLRGAIAYALSLHLEFDEDVRKVIVTTTLVVVLFTTICLGRYLFKNKFYQELMQQYNIRSNLSIIS